MTGTGPLPNIVVSEMFARGTERHTGAARNRKGIQKVNATVSPNIKTSSGFGQSRSGWTVGRISSVVSGSVLVLIAVALIATGGYFLTESTRDGGWLSVGHGTYQTNSYAVVTEPNDWSSQTYFIGNVEKARIRVAPSNAATPIFVGMAPSSDVEGYLSGVNHVVVHGGSNYKVAYIHHDGQAPTTPPAQAIQWTAQSSGTGVQTLEFNARKQHGDQVLVVMNSDGSPSVSGKAESAATQPSITWIASGLLVAGIVLAIGAVFLIVKPVKRAIGRS